MSDWLKSHQWQRAVRNGSVRGWLRVTREPPSTTYWWSLDIIGLTEREIGGDAQSLRKAKADAEAALAMYVAGVELRGAL